MGSARDISRKNLGHEDTHVLQCLLCHRVRLMYREHRVATEWESMIEFLGHYWLRFPDFVGIDTYCDECTVYYHQLLTYGQPAQDSEASVIPTPSSMRETVSMRSRESCQSSEPEPLPLRTMRSR